MKYKEFREYLILNEIPLNEDEERLIADNQFEISKTEEHLIIFPLGYVEVPYEFEMLKKVIELAETPLDEREDEKRYYIKHRFINDYTTKKYINLFTTGNAVLSDRHEGRNCQTKFTKAEIEELKEKFDTDLSDFELIEAEE